MKRLDCNPRRNPNGRRILRSSAIMAVAMIVTIGCGATWAKTGKQADSAIITKCKADLAKRLKLPALSVKLVEVQPTVWPDAGLGMPEFGKVYAQVLTPGSRVILDARGSKYLYVTSVKAYRYGGPINIWSHSMLYLQPVQDEPNLNGDLYQCSLLGTNSVRLASGVSDFYPQDKGVVIVKRRTSRSGHELLYVKTGKPGVLKPLHGAFDFGDAALNGAQDKWAAFVRPGLGTEWNVVVADVNQAGKTIQTLPLPDGIRPGRIAWSGETLFILVKKGEGSIAYQISPASDKPEWQEKGVYLFPGLTSYMLNKSESLEIAQAVDSTKPSIEVARVWFTGTRNVVARIDGLTLLSDDLLGGYAFIWGEKNSQPAAYTVDIYTGEVIPSFHGAVQSIKPFQYPPQNTPNGSAKPH